MRPGGRAGSRAEMTSHAPSRLSRLAHGLGARGDRDHLVRGALLRVRCVPARYAAAPGRQPDHPGRRVLPERPGHRSRSHPGGRMARPARRTRPDDYRIGARRGPRAAVGACGQHPGAVSHLHRDGAGGCRGAVRTRVRHRQCLLRYRAAKRSADPHHGRRVCLHDLRARLVPADHPPGLAACPGRPRHRRRRDDRAPFPARPAAACRPGLGTRRDWPDRDHGRSLARPGS